MIYTYNAPAKINIGLDVLGRRDDGYHDLKMIMQTIDLEDILTFTIKEGGREITMTCTDSSLSVDDTNLVMRAARHMADEFGIKSSIEIHLEKNIPIAAGMAGGSTDAATTFIAMNDIFGLGLSKAELMERAVNLGADIPYCILRGTALSEGIGDILTPLPEYKDVTILIVKPPINVSTAFVYGNLKIDSQTNHPDIDNIMNYMVQMNHSAVGSLLGNVLEDVTVKEYPVIDDIKGCMIKNGSLGALMSGSGPTVFGIFENDETAGKALEKCLLLVPGSFAKVVHTI